MLLGKNKPLDSNKDEQYTPRWIFEALNVAFDLDVCAPKEGSNANAKFWFHKEIDGLTQRWHGNVWMNPPYSSAKQWVKHFMDHKQGIALLPFSKAYWFIELWKDADGICPVYDIKFDQPDNSKKGIFMPVALFAYGQNNVKALINSNLGKVR